MDSKLEELLEARNIENENELKNALDKVISDHKSDEDTSLLDEAIELRVALEGVGGAAVEEHLKKIRKPLPEKAPKKSSAWMPAVKRVLPMAAAFAVIVSVLLFLPNIGNDVPVVPSTEPSSAQSSITLSSSVAATTATPATTTTPATTVSPATSTVPPSSTEPQAPPATGGMNWDWVYYSENFQEGFFLESYLPYSEYKEEFEDWKKDFVMFGKVGGREDFEYNTYTMITELGLPREKVEEWAYNWFAENYDVNSYAFEDKGPLSKEAFDLIYSGDKAGYYQLKVSPFAFVVGEYVINLKWLDEHSVEEYKEVGITYEKLMEYSVEAMAHKYCEGRVEEIMAKVNQLKEA